MDNQARALEADACTSKKSDEKEVVVAGASSHSCNGQTSECGKLIIIIFIHHIIHGFACKS